MRDSHLGVWGPKFEGYSLCPVKNVAGAGELSVQVHSLAHAPVPILWLGSLNA